jgi:hypothetical protein
MEALARLVSTAGQKRGGSLLNAIYQLMINSSDDTIRDLFASLLEKASEPYFNILKKWIF